MAKERDCTMNEKIPAKQRGQSLVLVAAAMVVLVGFVALAVDLSNAYYARRTAQNAADGAALAGASSLSAEINDRGGSWVHQQRQVDDAVQANMIKFAHNNGIEVTIAATEDEVSLKNANPQGWYVDTDRNRIQAMINGTLQDAWVGSETVPGNAAGVEAITHITATAYFGGIFGFDGYPVQARAVSSTKLACGSDCLVPIVTGVDLLLDQNDVPRTEECFHIWKERLINKDDDISQGLLGWVNWSWQESVCTGEWACEPERPCPVTQGSPCSEETLDANISPAVCASGFVQVGDWIAAAPGDMNSTDVRCALHYYLGYDDPSTTADDGCSDGKSHSFTVPVYDETTADLGIDDASCGAMPDPCDPYDITPKYALHYHVAGLARMQIVQYQLSEGQEYPPDDALAPEVLARINSCNTYYDFVVEEATPEPGSELTPTPTPEPPDGFRITVEFLEYVQDYSSSEDCFDPFGTLWASPKLTE
jgi:Flp pilus assembly protein TadG